VPKYAKTFESFYSQWINWSYFKWKVHNPNCLKLLECLWIFIVRSNKIYRRPWIFIIFNYNFKLLLYFHLKYFYEQLNDYFNHQTLSLIDNVSMVLSFHNTAYYFLWILATFLSTQRYDKYWYKLDRQFLPPELLDWQNRWSVLM